MIHPTGLPQPTAGGGPMTAPPDERTALAMANHPSLESYDLSLLRFIMGGATPVTPSVADTVTRRSGVPWVPAYGASELPMIACNPREVIVVDAVPRLPSGKAPRRVLKERFLEEAGRGRAAVS